MAIEWRSNQNMISTSAYCQAYLPPIHQMIRMINCMSDYIDVLDNFVDFVVWKKIEDVPEKLQKENLAKSSENLSSLRKKLLLIVAGSNAGLLDCAH